MGRRKSLIKVNVLIVMAVEGTLRYYTSDEKANTASRNSIDLVRSQILCTIWKRICHDLCGIKYYYYYCSIK